MGGKLKKLTGALVIVGAFIFSSSSVSAAPNYQKGYIEMVNYYDFIYFYNMHMGETVTIPKGDTIKVKVLSSTKVVTPSRFRPTVLIEVLEDDGRFGPDYIGAFAYYPYDQGNLTKTFNIKKFRDGSNKKAEIKLRYTANFQGSSIVEVHIEK